MSTSRRHAHAGTEVLPPGPLPLTGLCGGKGGLEGPPASEPQVAPQEMWAGSGRRGMGGTDSGPLWCLSPPGVPSPQKKLDQTDWIGQTCTFGGFWETETERQGTPCLSPNQNSKLSSLLFGFPKKICRQIESRMAGFVHSFFQNISQTQPFLSSFAAATSARPHRLLADGCDSP